MPDIQASVGLNVQGYLSALDQVIGKLDEYTRKAKEADDLSKTILKPPTGGAAPATNRYNEQKSAMAAMSTEQQKISKQMFAVQDILKAQVTLLEKIAGKEKERVKTAEKLTQEAQKVAEAQSKSVSKISPDQISAAFKANLEQVSSAFALKDNEFLERFRNVQLKKLAIAKDATAKEVAQAKAAEEQAERHLLHSKRTAFSRYEIIAENARKAIAMSYAKMDQSKIELGPQKAIEIMTRLPAQSGTAERLTQEAEERQLLKENPQAFKVINDFMRGASSVERTLKSEVAAQSKIAQQGFDEVKKTSIRDMVSTYAGQMKGMLDIKDFPLLERFKETRLARLELPRGATSADINQATLMEKQADSYFAIARRDAFARQRSLAEKTKTQLAEYYAGLDPAQVKVGPADAIKIMTRTPATPGTPEHKKQLEDELRLLQEHARAYEIINRYNQALLQLQDQLNAKLAAQEREAKKGFDTARRDAARQDIAIVEKRLAETKQLEWLQSTFQKAHGREITGFGRVEVTRTGQELMKTYARTPIDFEGQFSALKGVSHEESFQKVILALQKGNAELIQQYPELAKGANAYNRAIKTGEAESQRFVAHWDNFFRLVLARGVTLVFYSISNAIRQAAMDAAELWRGIAEVQTISKDSKLTVEEWALSVRHLSDVYHFAQQDIVEAIYEITSNQVAAGQSAVTFAGTAAGLAKATKSTLTESVNALSSIINSYNIDIANAEIISAQLFKTVELGRVRLSDMANTIGRLTSMSTLLGMRLEEVQGLIDLITIGGVKFERSSTYIVNMINSLLKPSEKMKAFFTSIKAESGEAAIAMYGFGGVLRRLMEYSHGQSGELAEIAKNLRAITGFASVTRNVDEYERMVENTKTAMKTYLEAQEYIYTGPGERLLEITTKAKNVFVSGAQDMLSALLDLDDWLSKRQGTLLSDVVRGATGANKIADLSAYALPIGAFTATALGARSIAAIANDPEISKAWTKFGTKAGIAIALAMGTQIRITLRTQKLLEEAGVGYVGMIKDAKIEMEKRYHEELDKIDDLIKKHFTDATEENTRLKTDLSERAKIWKDYYEEITRPLETTISVAGELKNIFSSMIDLQQNTFVGYAFNPVDELVRKVAVSRDIFSKLDQYGPENSFDIAKRFMTYAQSTFADLNKQIMSIEKSRGTAPESMFYGLLQGQRQELAGMMDMIVERYAQEVTGGRGMQPRDLYEALFETKDMETAWKDYFKDFKKMTEEVDRLLKEGVGTLEVIRAEIAGELTPEQKAMFERDVVSQKVFQDALESSKIVNTAQEEQSAALAELKKRREGIGAGTAAEFMMPGQSFSQLYATSKVLSEQGVVEIADTYAKAQEIERQFAAYKGIIPPDKQEEFDKQLREFISSFTYVNKELNARLKELADTSMLAPWRNTEKIAAQQILNIVDAELLKRLNPEGIPPVLAATAALASGGSVGGPKGTDTVPAWLTPGEFVIRRDVAQQHGPLLERLNAGHYANGGVIDPLQTGTVDLESALAAAEYRMRSKKRLNVMAGKNVSNFDPLYEVAMRGASAVDRTYSNVYGEQNTWEDKIKKNRIDEILFRQSGLKADRKKRIAESRSKAQSNIKPGRFTAQLGQYVTQPLDPESEEYKSLLRQIQAQDWEKELAPLRKQMDLASKGARYDARVGNKFWEERAKYQGEREYISGGGRNAFDAFYGSGTGWDYARAGLTGTTLAALAFGGAYAAPSMLSGAGGLGTGIARGVGTFLPKIGPKLLGAGRGILPYLGLVGAQEGYSYLTDPAYELSGIKDRLLDEILMAMFLKNIFGGIHNKFSGGSRMGDSRSFWPFNRRSSGIEPLLPPQMANGGWVNQPRGRFEFGGKVSGQTMNNYSTTAYITLQTSGNEAIDARKIMDNINREANRGTRRLTNVSSV